MREESIHSKMSLCVSPVCSKAYWKADGPELIKWLMVALLDSQPLIVLPISFSADSLCNLSLRLPKQGQYFLEAFPWGLQTFLCWMTSLSLGTVITFSPICPCALICPFVCKILGWEARRLNLFQSLLFVRHCPSMAPLCRVPCWIYKCCIQHTALSIWHLSSSVNSLDHLSHQVALLSISMHSDTCTGSWFNHLACSQGDP